MNAPGVGQTQLQKGTTPPTSSSCSPSGTPMMHPPAGTDSKSPAMSPPPHPQGPLQDLESSYPESDSLTDLDLEQLGRQRPDAFSSALKEVLFCASLVVSFLMSEYFISGFNIILPDLARALDIPSGSQIWPASVFSLVTGSFLLPLGRLADMYGAYPVFNFGLVWFFIWSLIAGFSTNYQMLIAARALGGLGPAAFLPTSIMLIGKIYRPGPRKNVVFGLWSAFAPVGFFIGIIIGGATTQLLTWRVYFWVGAGIMAVVVVAAFLTVPDDREATRKENAHIKMDWWGLATIVPGLVLLTFAITDGAHAEQGFATPYIIATCVCGVVFLAAAVYVEGWVAAQPLLPFDLFHAKYMKRLTIGLFFTYGIFGIFLYYASLHIVNFMGASALKTAVWFTPMAAGGLMLACVGGFTLHLLPGRVIFIISGLGSMACVLLFALIPEDGTFWAFVFPAMVCATIGVDVAFLVSNIFITTNVPRHRQGVAGALINSLLFLGISFCLGLADLAVSESEKRVGDGKQHKVAFWLATACGATATLIFTTVKIGKAESELTADEKARRARVGQVQ